MLSADSPEVVLSVCKLRAGEFIELNKIKKRKYVQNNVIFHVSLKPSRQKTMMNKAERFLLKTFSKKYFFESGNPVFKRLIKNTC